jgi:alkylation response protein AidB-like acyl-CoA dehydrogenase
LLKFGSEALKRRFLPEILSVGELWGQGFSEPGAGSDLASLRTQARVEGGEWVIDGQKVWTTFGAHADWLYVLCRTDQEATRHRGLSMLLVNASQPGVEIRPIRNIAAAGEFCEVFFTGARTPVDHVVGAPGDGWRVAMATLSMERGAALMPMQFGFEREVDRVIQLAGDRGTPAAVRHALVDSWIAVRIMRTTNLRTIGEILLGREPGPQASTSKLFASTHHQRLLELATEILAEEATVVSDDYVPDPILRAFLLSRAETIYGGSSQIQRNIIGERVLGLPKEPAAAR